MGILKGFKTRVTKYQKRREHDQKLRRELNFQAEVEYWKGLREGKLKAARERGRREGQKRRSGKLATATKIFEGFGDFSANVAENYGLVPAKTRKKRKTRSTKRNRR
jgi:hypothetical protein